MKRRAIVAVGFILVVAACGGAGTATSTTVTETSTTSGEPVSTTQADETQVDQSQPDGLAAQAGDLVSVHYIGTLDDGTVFDESRPRGSTLDFTVGGGQMIAGFDAGVVGMEVGDTRTVGIAPEDAYGLKSDAAIFEISRDQADGDFEIGDQVVLGSGQSGVVVALTDTTITVDANPRLAGETLTFEIEMMAINRPAS
ncbi:MAG: FKBP-type peptidyl-prolyl cis-trans isomerase [Acidobacteria bacterium]|nr:FKBP-type peptidyl-prolyl cis-trans isomerase [Acidobacteriota bacterium]